jgi:hypothetical protein
MFVENCRMTVWGGRAKYSEKILFPCHFILLTSHVCCHAAEPVPHTHTLIMTSNRHLKMGLLTEAGCSLRLRLVLPVKFAEL